MKAEPKKAEKELNKIINDENESSTEFEIAREADKRSRELQLKLGESRERLWVTIGLIQVLFAEASDLERFIEPIVTGDIFEDLKEHNW